MIRVKLFRSKCNGCSYCSEIAPDFWDMNFSDGKVDLIGSLKNKGVYEIIIDDIFIDLFKDCELNCSTNAIKIE